MAGKFLNPSLNTNTATVSTVTESSKRAAMFAEQSHTKDGTVFILYCNWASMRQNLSSGFPTKRVSNQSPPAIEIS